MASSPGGLIILHAIEFLSIACERRAVDIQFVTTHRHCLVTSDVIIIIIIINDSCSSLPFLCEVFPVLIVRCGD